MNLQDITRLHVERLIDFDVCSSIATQEFQFLQAAARIASVECISNVSTDEQRANPS